MDKQHQFTNNLTQNKTKQGAIYLSLVGENIDSATLEENWVADSKGASYLDESRFFEAVFELADVWVDSIDGDEYADFLERVLSQLCRNVQ